MIDYQRAKEQHEVHLELANGQGLLGSVFLDSSEYTPGESIRVLDLLRHEDSFLPFKSATGDFFCISKACLITTTLSAEWELNFLKDPGEEAFIVQTVEILTSAGKTLSGQFYIEPIEGFSRLSDQLIRDKKFIAVKSGDKAVLINTAHIVYIKIF